MASLIAVRGRSSHFIHELLPTTTGVCKMWRYTQKAGQIVRHYHHHLVHLPPPSRDDHDYRSRDTRCACRAPISASRWRHDGTSATYVRRSSKRPPLCKTTTFDVGSVPLSLMDLCRHRTYLGPLIFYAFCKSVRLKIHIF